MVRVIQPVDLNPGDFTNPQTGAAGEITIRVDAASGVGAAISAAITPLAGMGPPAAAPTYPKLFYIDVATTPNQHYWWNGSSWRLLGDGAGVGADGVVTGASLTGTTLTLTRSLGAPVTLSLASLQDGTVTGASLAAGTLTLTRSVGAPITVNLTALQDGVVTGLSLVGTTLTANRSVGSPLTVDLSSLAGGGGGGADGVVTAASLSGANILTLTRSIGGPVTVDLSSLAGGGGGGGVLNTIASPLSTITIGGTAADRTIDVNANTMFDGVPDATAFQIGNLTGAEQVWVELANGQLRQIAISDLPIGGDSGLPNLVGVPDSVMGSGSGQVSINAASGPNAAPGNSFTIPATGQYYALISAATRNSGASAPTVSQARWAQLSAGDVLSTVVSGVVSATMRINGNAVVVANNGVLTWTNANYTAFTSDFTVQEITTPNANGTPQVAQVPEALPTEGAYGLVVVRVYRT